MTEKNLIFDADTVLADKGDDFCHGLLIPKKVQCSGILVCLPKSPTTHSLTFSIPALVAYLDSVDGDFAWEGSPVVHHTRVRVPKPSPNPSAGNAGTEAWKARGFDLAV